MTRYLGIVALSSLYMIGPAYAEGERFIVPEILVGRWHTALGSADSLSACSDVRAKLDGIRIDGDRLLSALNGSYSCTIEDVGFFDPALYGPDMLGVWSYEASCMLHYSPDAISNERSEWKEYGSFKLSEAEGLKLEISSSDRKASYFDPNQGQQNFTIYRQCQ